MIRVVLIGLPALAALLLAAGCATTKHDIAAAQPGQVSVCTKCYDTVQRYTRQPGSRFGSAGTYTTTTHRCEECKDEMTIYSENGVIKVRCPKCAPEGVACDRCTPKAAAK